MSALRCPKVEHGAKKMDSYFIHDQYAGISAYINSPGDPSARNANMLAVGALVPLEHGKMGKSWLHAEGLKDLARYGEFLPRGGMVELITQ